MAKIRTVEKLQQQLTGAEAASRKHKVENEALKKTCADQASRIANLEAEVAALKSPSKAE